MTTKSKFARHLLLIFIICAFTSLRGWTQNTLAQNASTHYSVLPSAFGVLEDELFLTNINVLLNGVEYGFSENFSGRAMIELFNPIFASESMTYTLHPKLSLPINENLNIATDFIFVGTIGDGTIMIPHAVMTLGSRQKNISIGGGYVFDRLYGAQAEYFGMSLGGILPINNKWALVTDNWFLFSDQRLVGNPFDFLSISARTTIKNKYHLDFGLFLNTDQYDFGKYPWPIVKFYSDFNDIFGKKTKSNNTSSENSETRRPRNVQNQQNSQTKSLGQKALYAEIGGVGGIYSINFDARLINTPKNNGIGFRAGLASIFGVTTMPLQVNYLIGRRHYLEVGLGTTLATAKYDYGDGKYGGFNATGSSSLKYRYQSEDKGLFFNIGFDLFFGGELINDAETYWAGIGLGYSF